MRAWQNTFEGTEGRLLRPAKYSMMHDTTAGETPDDLQGGPCLGVSLILARTSRGWLD